MVARSCTGRHCVRAVFFQAARRQDDDRHGGEAAIGPDRPADVETGWSRHPHVEHHHIWGMLPEQPSPLAAVARLERSMPVVLDGQPYHPPDLRRIIDHENESHDRRTHARGSWGRPDVT
jgi:hypothetical protein